MSGLAHTSLVGLVVGTITLVGMGVVLTSEVQPMLAQNWLAVVLALYGISVFATWLINRKVVKVISALEAKLGDVDARAKDAVRVVVKEQLGDVDGRLDSIAKDLSSAESDLRGVIETVRDEAAESDKVIATTLREKSNAIEKLLRSVTTDVDGLAPVWCVNCGHYVSKKLASHVDVPLQGSGPKIAKRSGRWVCAACLERGGYEEKYPRPETGGE